MDLSKMLKTEDCKIIFLLLHSSAHYSCSGCNILFRHSLVSISTVKGH